MGGRSKSMKRFKIRMEGLRSKPLTSEPLSLGQSSPAPSHTWLHGKEALAIVARDQEYCFALRLASNARKSKQRAATVKPIKAIGTKICGGCGATQTPQWRVGHNGATLCNACGVRYRRSKLPAMIRKKQKEQQQRQKKKNGSTN